MKNSDNGIENHPSIISEKYRLRARFQEKTNKMVNCKKIHKRIVDQNSVTQNSAFLRQKIPEELDFAAKVTIFPASRVSN